MHWLPRLFPLLGTLARYRMQDARGDLLAGLTTAVMLVPQGMAYALLAGLPPIYGLYASLLPLLVYALFGSSRQLAVGPVAMVSLLVAAAAGSLAEPGSEAYVAIALVLALMVGVLQLAMGVMRLGFVVNFLSHPVISGFTSAAAIVIALSQLRHLLGFAIPRSHHAHAMVAATAAGLPRTHLVTLLIGALSLAALVVLEKRAPRLPRALLLVVATTLATWGLDLHQVGVAVVGEVPAGLPPLALPAVDLPIARKLMGPALAIALVGFMESIAVAKKYARDNGYDVDANQELVGLGLANVLGALAGSYPVTGGLSRTAVNAQAGARSQAAGLLTALVVGATLLWLTPLLAFLPKATLAAIIVSAVAGLVDVREIQHLWRVKRSDLAMLLLTFAVTLAVGIEAGIGAGVLASIALLVLRSTRPHVAVLGRLPGSRIYRNIARFAEAQRTGGVLALRLDAQLYYGNVQFLRETLDALEQRHGPARAVVLDASGINQIDASGDAALREIARGYQARGVELLLANVKGPVRDVFERSGLYALLGPERFFLCVADAVDHAASLHAQPA